MKWNLSGAAIPPHLPYAAAINQAAIDTQASPCGLYAIAWRETIAVERSGWLASQFPGKTAATVITGDGGHGIFQLTDSFPVDWSNPYANAKYAADYFYDPYLKDWIARGMTGDALLKCAADDFNAGDRRVLLWHNAGNADGATTGGNYGGDVVQIYTNLVACVDPDLNRPS